MSLPLQAITLAVAIVAGGVWFGTTPGSNGLTQDRQEQAADVAHRAQARGRLLAASHEVVGEASDETLLRSSGEQPGRDDHSVAYAAAPGNAGADADQGNDPTEAVAAPDEITTRPGERVAADGNSVTDVKPNSPEEVTDWLAAKVNAGKDGTQGYRIWSDSLDMGRVLADSHD